MKFNLRPLCESENQDVYAMFQEIPAYEMGFENPAFGMTPEKFKDFCCRHVGYSRGENLKSGKVPDTYYILSIDEHPVGFCKLRHFLNEFLRSHGGHIGYAIRPSQRGKKYGNLILRELLNFARLKQIDRVLLTILAHNLPSRRVCENNGGVLEKIQPCADGEECFYWIDVPHV